jgi:hypothetical protein
MRAAAAFAEIVARSRLRYLDEFGVDGAIREALPL